MANETNEATEAAEAAEAAERTNKTLTVRQVKSSNGRLKRHKACLAGLGLRRIGHVVEVEDTPAVRGMVARVSYLVEVMDAADTAEESA